MAPLLVNPDPNPLTLDLTLTLTLTLTLPLTLTRTLTLSLTLSLPLALHRRACVRAGVAAARDLPLTEGDAALGQDGVTCYSVATCTLHGGGCAGVAECAGAIRERSGDGHAPSLHYYY